MGMSFLRRTRDLLSRKSRKANEGPILSRSQQTGPSHQPKEGQLPSAADGSITTSSHPGDSVFEEVEPIIIIGAGIVGLALALALEKHCGIKVNLYEQAAAFHDDVGAGMGCYPNGLRVIRDISSDLLGAIQDIGYPYLLRRYEVSFSFQDDSLLDVSRVMCNCLRCTDSQFSRLTYSVMMVRIQLLQTSES